MTLKFIIFGELNRKHFLPFILTLSNLGIEMISRFYPDNKIPDNNASITNSILDTGIFALGFLSSIFIPCIFKFDKDEISRENEIQKRKWLHYLVFIVIFIIHMICKAIPPILKGYFVQVSGQNVNSFSEGPFVHIGLEMICMPIATRCLLKYKYFLHHYISIIAFVLFGNICDLILGYYSQMVDQSPWVTIIEFVNIIIDVLFYSSEKYMLEMLYYPYWKINVILGSVLMVYTTGGLIYALADRNSPYQFVKDFYLYFEKINPGIIVGKIILALTSKIGFCTFSILSVYYFNPNFFLINYQITKFVLVLIDQKQTSRKYYCIIFFVLQFFCLLVYLEILELNFCGLNKNVKRNVDKRGIDELLGNDGRDSTLGLDGKLDINKDYCIDSLENVEKNNKFVEMSPRTESYFHNEL